jgi:hypothetical protein
VSKISRALLSLAALAFGSFHAALGFAVLDRFSRQDLPLIALAIYSLALVLSLVTGRKLALPKICAWLCVLVAAVVPALVNAALGGYQPGNYTTWYISGVATLLAITAVRQGRLQSTIGTVILVVQVLVFAGPMALFNSGLAGAVLLVFVGQISSYLLSSAEAEAARYREQASATLAATAANSAARQERKARLSQTLQRAMPMLELIAQRGSALTEAERLEARLLEAELRDQIRGRNLAVPMLTSVVGQLRRNGVDVQLLDDGGIDDLEQPHREELLAEVAQQIAGVKTGKVVVRAVRGESWRVTVAALRRDSAIPDLFLRL